MPLTIATDAGGIALPETPDEPETDQRGNAPDIVADSLMLRLAMLPRRLAARPMIGYAIAIASFLIGLTTRAWFEHLLPPGFPYLTFFPAVIVTTFVAGMRPGLLCALLSGLAAWYFFIPPRGGFGLNAEIALALGLYAFVVAVDILLIHSLQHIASRLIALQARSVELYGAQRTMFQELQHRIANNMMFVSSVLHLQRRRVARDPDQAIDALDQASHRLELLSRIHRRLYDPVSAGRSLEEHLAAICEDLRQATGHQHVRFVYDMVPAQMDLARLVTLSLLVTEIVTNSLKHAFAGRDAGTIRLTLQPEGSTGLRLTIADDGVGWPADFDPRTSTGLGNRIIESLASQLGGSLGFDGRDGAATTLLFSP